MRFTVTRTRFFPYGMLGILRSEQPIFQPVMTLEPPEGIAIPEGIYPLQIYHSPKFNHDVLLLSNVPGHTAIEIHIGNVPADTRDCILVGENRAESTLALLDSAAAFWRLMYYAKCLTEPMDLQVLSVPHGYENATQ